MSYSNGPRIVTDGLVCCIDAANTKSYSGTGTTWTDLSSNNNNVTLTNGPTFNSSNNGSIVFDGVNDSAVLPTNFFSFPALTTFTISLWFKSTQSNGGTIFGQQSNSSNPASAGGWVPAVYLQSDGLIRIEPFWTSSSTNFILSSSALNDGSWCNVTTTFDNGTNQLYINGVYNTQQTGKTLSAFPGSPSNYYYILGAGQAASRSLGTNYFSGNISTFNFYNKALSSSEISQNYNALKGRYNL